MCTADNGMVLCVCMPIIWTVALKPPSRPNDRKQSKRRAICYTLDGRHCTWHVAISVRCEWRDIHLWLYSGDGIALNVATSVCVFGQVPAYADNEANRSSHNKRILNGCECGCEEHRHHHHYPPVVVAYKRLLLGLSTTMANKKSQHRVDKKKTNIWM